MKNEPMWQAVVAQYGASTVAVGMVAVRDLLDALPLSPDACPSAYRERLDAKCVRLLARSCQKSPDFCPPPVELEIPGLQVNDPRADLQSLMLSPCVVVNGTSVIEALRRAAAETRRVEFMLVPVIARNRLAAASTSPVNARVAAWTDNTVAALPCLRGLVTREQTALARRSKHLFTYSAWLGAHRELAPALGQLAPQHAALVALTWWTAVAEQLPQWKAVQARELASSDVRAGFVHCHAAMLQAFGMLGNRLLILPEPDWRTAVSRLSAVDFSRDGPLWSGNVVIGGKVSKHRQSVRLAFQKLEAICAGPSSPHL